MSLQPQNPIPNRPDIVARIKESVESAVYLCERDHKEESADQAWRALKQLGLSETSQIVALDWPTLASRIAIPAVPPIAIALWIVAQSEKQSPVTGSCINAYRLMSHAMFLSPTNADCLRTYNEYLRFNVARGVRDTISDPSLCAAEILRELTEGDRHFSNHLKGRYNLNGDHLPPHVLNARPPVVEACSWTLEHASHTAWRLSAFLEKTIGASGNVQKVRTRALHFAECQLALHHLSTNAERIERHMQETSHTLSDVHRRRCAVAMMTIAAIYEDKGDIAHAREFAKVAVRMHKNAKPEDRQFLVWAVPVNASSSLTSANVEPAITLPPAPTHPASLAAQLAPSPADKPKTANLVPVDPGIRWDEFQVFFPDLYLATLPKGSQPLVMKLPNGRSDAAGDIYVRAAEHEITLPEKFIEMLTAAYFDGFAIQHSAPELRQVFEKHARERLPLLSLDEPGLIELVRLHQTLKFILRQPGIHRDERQPLEKLERDYEKHSHVIAKAVAKRGLHAALNDFFHAML